MRGKKPSTLQSLPLFQLCHGKVCHKAMLMAYEQLQFVRRINGPLPSCTGTYHKSLGAPCKPTMQRVLFDNQPLDPAEFHVHWRYERDAGPLPLLYARFFVRDPAVLRSEVRPRQRGNGNARIPSTHERRAAEVEQRARNAAQVAGVPAPVPRGRGRGRGAGRRERVQEANGGAFIRFRA
jgi:hypothetical protein